jgi:hypothetical protein
MESKALYPKDVFYKQRFSGLGHISRDGGALGDRPSRDEPGLSSLYSRWYEHTETLGRRKVCVLWALLYKRHLDIESQPREVWEPCP